MTKPQSNLHHATSAANDFGIAGELTPRVPQSAQITNAFTVARRAGVDPAEFTARAPAMYEQYIAGGETETALRPHLYLGTVNNFSCYNCKQASTTATVPPIPEEGEEGGTASQAQPVDEAPQPSTSTLSKRIPSSLNSWLIFIP